MTLDRKKSVLSSTRSPFFGIHLILLGVLAFYSKSVPKIIGILLGIAGLGYTLGSLILILLPGYDPVIYLSTFVGALILMVWLIIK